MNCSFILLFSLTLGFVSPLALADRSVLAHRSAPAVNADCQSSISNFYAVVPGTIYRSAQPRARDLARTIEQCGIKTVLNLRGVNAGKSWYDEEARIVEEKGIKLVSIPMSARTVPTKENLITLLDTFENQDNYPMLVHCRAGADRSGEAIAIYAIEYMGYTHRKAAKEMLQIKYRHFHWFTPAKRYFIEHVYQNPVWAREEYNHCEHEYAPSSCSDTE